MGRYLVANATLSRGKLFLHSSSYAGFRYGLKSNYINQLLNKPIKKTAYAIIAVSG